ncbi:MAG TPA: InlB B-repeat-containing protein, partial [Tenuifilaceae bacterium]|nr:InlB B-repeat-containing protein [Tenuifilaceae bacterium]
MIHLRKGILIVSLIFISAITFAQVSITVNVPTAGGFSTALRAAGGDANTVTNLKVTGNINADDISFMNANMSVLAVLDLEAVQIKSSGYYTPADYFPRYAFSNKISLTSIKLPSSITVIGSSAFKGCGGLVGDLTIPNTVTSIESNAFYNCTGFNGNIILSNSLKTIGYKSFCGCNGFTGNLIIPESVISIGVGSFMNCIGFSGNLTIPNSVVSIDDEAFNNCTGFNGNLILPNSLITIGAGAFSGCRNLIGNLTIPNSVTSIGPRAFHSCNGFSGLTLSTSLISISDYVFQNCHGFVGNLVIPNSVTSIGGGAFNLCDGFNGTLTISNSLKEIKHGAFLGCNNLTGSISIPSSVISIGDYAFSQCEKLTGSLSIPNSVKSIGKNAFQNCFRIKGTLVIPSSVDSIGDYAFDGWINMTKISSAGIFPASVGANTFNEMCKKYCQLVVPLGATANYRAADYWKDFVNISEVLYVYFNTNGGTSIADINPTYNSTIAEPIPPTLTGYTFGGWYKDPAFTNPWNFSSDVVTTNTTLYAKWNPNLYTIVFDSQGGSNVTNVSAYYNTTITAPVNPTLAGFTFDGWYKETNCINLWNFDADVIKDNTVLYAKWVVTVTFDSQGGSNVLSKKTNYNTTISAPTVPTRTGYSFGGWYKESACINTWTFSTDRVTANTTLYAKWTINTYIVTFNSNGGTPVANVTAVYNAKISEPTPPTKTGYTFAGWYINLTDDFSFNFNLYMITSNLTLQAKWVPNTYYVTFYSEGTIVDSRGAEYNTTVERPEDPIRTGHIFNGWYKEPTFVTLWNFGADKVTSDMSLYAKWTAITYTVTFNSQGGSPVSSVVVNHGTKVAEPTPPVRNGYTLRGWYDQPTDGFVWFFDYKT